MFMKMITLRIDNDDDDSYDHIIIILYHISIIIQFCVNYDICFAPNMSS